MRYLIIFSYMLLAFVFSFCKKEKSSEPIAAHNSSTIKPTKTIYISNELKEWGYFNVGSYWIYKDSVSNALDSIFVRGITTTFIKHITTQDTDLIFEEIRIQLKEYGTDWILSGNTISKFGGAYGARMGIFCLDTTSTVSLPAYGINQNHSVSNFDVLNSNYGNVRFYAFKYFFDGYGHSSSYDHYETYYWKKNIGFIQFLYGQSHYYTSKLLRYNILQ